MLPFFTVTFAVSLFTNVNKNHGQTFKDVFLNTFKSLRKILQVDLCVNLHHEG